LNLVLYTYYWLLLRHIQVLRHDIGCHAEEGWRHEGSKYSHEAVTHGTATARCVEQLNPPPKAKGSPATRIFGAEDPLLGFLQTKGACGIGKEALDNALVDHVLERAATAGSGFLLEVAVAALIPPSVSTSVLRPKGVGARGEVWRVDDEEFLRDATVGSTDEDIAASTSSLVVCSVEVDQLSAPPRWVEAQICDSGLRAESQIARLENAAGSSSGEVQKIMAAAVVSLLEQHTPKEGAANLVPYVSPSTDSVSEVVSMGLREAISAVINLPKGDGCGGGGGGGECGRQLPGVAGHLLKLATGFKVKALAASTMMASLATLLGDLLQPGNTPPDGLRSTVISMAQKAATTSCAVSSDPRDFAKNLLAAATGGERIAFTANELNKLCAAAAGGVVPKHHGNAAGAAA
jgi:hypothetical protein